MLLTVLTLIAFCGTAVNAYAAVEGTCVKSDPGLRWLQSVLSDKAVISCKGQPMQMYNANRYWGLQFSKNASVVVFPANTQDVSYTVQATKRTPLGNDFTFVGGGRYIADFDRYERTNCISIQVIAC